METLSEILTHAADGLLILASFGAAVFCLVLSRRLTRLTSIDSGLGGAIAVLSAQVDDMNRALGEMKSGTRSSAEQLEALNREARQLTEELEMMLAACHDLDGAAAEAPDPGSVAAGHEGDAAPLPVFGSRRSNVTEACDTAEPTPESAAIPFFLKNRSRLAGMV